MKAVVAAFNQEKALVGALSEPSDGTFSSTSAGAGAHSAVLSSAHSRLGHDKETGLSTKSPVAAPPLLLENGDGRVNVE